MKPKVSIITPSYNQDAYLEETINSVLIQDYPQIEYMIVDGASSDGSVGIVEKYSERLAWWVSEADSGQACAINKGFARASGEIIAWLNSDDYYLPGALVAAADAFAANPDALMVYADMLAVDAQGETTNILHYSQLDLAGLLAFNIIGQPAVFMRRSALEKAGYLDLDFHFLLDHQLWLKIASQGEIIHVDEIWAAARYHDDAKNRAQAAKFGREAFRIVDWAEKQPSLQSTLAANKKRILASAHRVDARYLLDSGQAFAALRAWLHALWLSPPVALRRMNLFISAILHLFGLRSVYEAYLRQRKARLEVSD